MNWSAFTFIACGVLWSAAYIFMIVKAVKDKKVAMPIWAMAMNFTWESFYLVAYFGNNLGTYVRLVWLLLDLVLLMLLLKYNRLCYPEHLKKFFYPLVGVAFATCLAMQFAFYFGSDRGSIYSVYINNLIMSISFLTILVQATDKGPKEALRGHCVYAAICKMLGTASIAFHDSFSGGNVDVFILISGILILLFDILYIVAIGVEMHKLKNMEGA